MDADAVIDKNLDRFYRFQIKPADEGVNEACRIVVHDKVLGEFCALHVLKAGESWQGSLRDLSPNPFSLKVKLQVMREGRWRDHIPYRPLAQEYLHEETLKYLFFPHPGARRLIVVFQAINTRQAYNYIGTLAGVNAHRLYIKDDYGSDPATRSSYYLGPDRVFSIADQVQRLIAQLTRELGLSAADVITAGSSKGGYAAIYHGLRARAGDVIVGGPQIMLGSYLRSENLRSIRPPILKYLTGSNSDEAAAWLDTVMVDLVKEFSRSRTVIHFHIGIKEPHYERDALPFFKMANDAGITVIPDLQKYSLHEHLARFFPNFLKDTANSIINGEVTLDTKG